jgi:nucleoside-diphosphate-sugar epimerase
VWLHVAGDVRFKPLGDVSVSSTNRDHTANFLSAARTATHRPRAVAHTSTFYVHARRGGASDVYHVPEDFLPPEEMEHDNAYGHSKLQAETYLREQVRTRDLPFRLLVFRPDIVAHHIPVDEVARHRLGLLVDDFKMIFQLIASMLGAGAGPAAVLEYLPADLQTRVYTSDVDSIARGMAQLALLSGDGGAGFGSSERYRVFNLVNRWEPLTVGLLRDVCESLGGGRTSHTQVVPAERFWTELLPQLPPAVRLLYATLVEPFATYLTRPTTLASTRNVDAVLGETWHNLHPAHGRDITHWFRSGVLAAFPALYARPAFQGVS